jgi:hypothetical protein
MKQPDDETELRRYLLGELTPEELAQVKERLFLDSDYFRQLQAAEDELIDDYIYEELSTAERGRFETYFLVQPGRRKDIRIAQALKRYISAEAQPLPFTQDSAAVALPRPPLAESGVVFSTFRRSFSSFARLSLAAAALIILAIGIWLLISVVRNRERSPPVQVRQPVLQETKPAPPQEEITTNSQPSNSPPTQQEQRVERREQGPGVEEKHVENRTGRDAPQSRKAFPPDEATSGSTLAVLLIPGGGVRGGGATSKVPLSSGIKLVNLQLPLIESSSYPNYRALLQTDGRTIFTLAGLKPTDDKPVKFVIVTVPAKILSSKTYQIKLIGITNTTGETRSIATYAFQVEGR